MSVALKTLAMKARVYNQIRKNFYKKPITSFSPEEKIKMFDKIFGLNLETHWELNNYKHKRKAKATLYAERVARGYNFKKKTKKEDYESSKTEDRKVA